MIKVTNLKRGRTLGSRTFATLAEAVSSHISHLPAAPGWSKAEWLAKELSENNGFFETRLGCQPGYTIRFEETTNDAA